MGCDNNLIYNNYAIDRLKNTVERPEEYWIELDRKNQERRESIR